tara:strand:+ start:574 stop:1464 length:891 start_codon:yes stop_codon:yes gene_type:complete
MPRDQDFYHCAWSKGYKIFFSLCELAGVQPIYWNKDDVFSKKYEIVFIDRADGLDIFNSIRSKLSYKKSFYWCETEDFSKGVDYTGFISTEFMKNSKKENSFWCGNIANGEKIYKARDSDVFSMIFLGRVTSKIASKINVLGKTYPDLQIYVMPITVPGSGGRDRDFKFNNMEEYINLQNYFGLENLIVLKPQPHSKLNQYLEALSPTFGFVPSIHDLSYNKMQPQSSSKIFDYYAAGIPCLTEWNVPEFFMPYNNIYKKRIIIENFLYKKNDILEYSNKNIYPCKRAKEILENIK